MPRRVGPLAVQDASERYGRDVLREAIRRDLLAAGEQNLHGRRSPSMCKFSMNTNQHEQESADVAER